MAAKLKDRRLVERYFGPDDITIINKDGNPINCHMCRDSFVGWTVDFEDNPKKVRFYCLGHKKKEE